MSCFSPIQNHAAIYQTNTTGLGKWFNKHPPVNETNYAAINLLALRHTKYGCMSPPPTLSSYGEENSKTVNEKKKKIRIHDPCYPFKRFIYMKHVTHLYYIQTVPLTEMAKDGSYPANETITMVSVTTLSRWRTFELFVERWKGPIIVVFYATAADANEMRKRVLASESMMNRPLVIHVVYSVSVSSNSRLNKRFSVQFEKTYNHFVDRGSLFIETIFFKKI